MSCRQWRVQQDNVEIFFYNPTQYETRVRNLFIQITVTYCRATVRLKTKVNWKMYIKFFTSFRVSRLNFFSITIFRSSHDFMINTKFLVKTFFRLLRNLQTNLNTYEKYKIKFNMRSSRLPCVRVIFVFRKI